MFVEFHFGEVVMTFNKALIAKKIADDCGFMKGEAVEILEKTARNHEGKACCWGRRYDLMASGNGPSSQSTLGQVGTLRLESPWCWMPEES